MICWRWVDFQGILGVLDILIVLGVGKARWGELRRWRSEWVSAEVVVGGVGGDREMVKVGGDVIN